MTLTPKLMILGDAPTKTTGFARVVRANMEQWLAADVFSEIHVWGIGYWGYPHDYDKRVKIWLAAGPHDHRWESTENLSRFAAVLEQGGFTHLWMLQDLWGLGALATLLRRLGAQKGLRSLLYFPVDAELDRNWTEILSAVTVPVAYCEFGREEAKRALLLPTGPRKEDLKLDKARRDAAGRLKVLPHGVDDCFRPITLVERAAMRRSLTNGRARPEDRLIVNVSTHQRRKGLAQTIQLHAALWKLRERMPKDAPRFIFYLHCEPVNRSEGTSLYMMADQLGTAGEIGRTLFFAEESYFRNGAPALMDSGLNGIYNAADLLLSTSLGEGWGLPLTEAMAALTAVAGPDHTSVRELLGEGRGLRLPLCPQADAMVGDMSRFRRRVDVEQAALLLPQVLLLDGQRSADRENMVARAKEWVSRPEMHWAHIAREWLKLMEVG